jgi:y4mF family transcriptional regulator
MLIQYIGGTIRKRRKQLGITQPHLAELAQVSPNTVYKLERGKVNASLEVIERLADVLGMEIELKVKVKK